MKIEEKVNRAKLTRSMSVRGAVANVILHELADVPSCVFQRQRHIYKDILGKRHRVPSCNISRVQK